MANGAYFTLSASGCQVLTFAYAQSGSWQWNPFVNPGMTYGVKQWNDLADAHWGSAYKVPCLAHCPGCSGSVPQQPSTPGTQSPTAPGGAVVVPPSAVQPPPPPSAGVPPTETPPQKPITGPEEKNPCAPAMAQRNDSDQFGFDTFEHLTMPRVGEIHFVRHGSQAGLGYEPPTTKGARYTKAPDVRAREQGGLIDVADLGTGDGYIVVHPADINEFGLRGDSVHPEGAWAPSISRTALLLLNANRDSGTTGDAAKTYLAFGLPSARPELRAKPRSGVYFDFNAATGVLNIQHTDADGGNTTVPGGLTVDGSPIGGSVTFPLEAPDNATGAQYAFDAGTVPGSDLAGVGFDQNVQQGPALYDTNGDNQLYVSTSGVTIPGKLTVNGLIDPTGLELTPVAANPGGKAANTLWLDSGASNALKHGANRVMTGNNNLSEVANAATARSNIGAGTGNLNLTGISSVGNLVQVASGGVEDAGFAAASVYRSGGTDVPVTDGGTGASTAAGALANLGAEPLTCIARGSGAVSNINSTSVVNQASATNTVAAGDTFSFYLSGYILNNSGGACTYTVRVTIGATTFDLAFNATVAASASNLSWVNVVADVAVISSSSIGCTIQVRRGAPAAAGTAQSNVLAQDRNIVRTSGNNETGSKTIAIGILSDANTATQTLTRTRAEIYKGGAI